MNTKECTRCKQILPVDMFYRNKNSKDSLTSRCKKCHAEASGYNYTPKEEWKEGHRACTKCGEIKPFSEFNKSKKGRFGLDSKCRQCKSTAKPQPQPREGHQFCTGCGEEKPFTAEYFRRTKKTKSGLYSQCRVCARNSAKEWRKQKIEEDPDYRKKLYWKNPEQHRAQTRTSYRKNIENRRAYNKRRYWENRDEELRKAREYYLENSEREKERSRQWRQDNPERYREYNQQWIEDNPETYKAMQQAGWQRRRARKQNLPHDLTLEEWQYCLDYWNNACAVCGDGEDIHADHWIALSNDDCPGTVVDNMIPLCAHCNATKHAIDAERWLREKFGDDVAVKKLAEIEAYFELVIDRENDSES